MRLYGLLILLLLPAFADAVERSPDDLARDQTSKPYEILTFAGVEQGWTVMDMFAGGGYYSELLSAVVGPGGKVYLHNNQAYMQGGGFAARLRNNRLPNVEPYIREVEDINLPSSTLDMVLMVMAYHDAYFVANGWTVTAPTLLKTTHRLLKPGGVLLVVDHHAQPGSGQRDAQSLHRIDADFAVRDIEGYGFRLDARSDILKNSSDDLAISVFDPAVRGKTSRFALRFVKPTD